MLMKRLLTILLLMPLFVYANGNSEEFYIEKERGWHWYEEPPPEPIKDEEDENPVVPSAGSTSQSESSEAGPAPMSVEWVKATLPKLEEIAIDNPTRENVRNYYYAQRIMMDKAQRFSTVAAEVVRNDPLLDENNRLPFASAAKVAYFQKANAAKDDVLDSLKDVAGLWFFFDETCSYCKQQVNPINELYRKYDLTIEVIHKQGGGVTGLAPGIKVRRATGQFESLGIKFTPAVVMVRPPEDFYIVSQGFVAFTTLTDRIFAAAHEQGLVDEDQFYAANPMEKGILRAENVTSDVVDWDDANEWVPFIQGQLLRIYGFEVDENEDDR